MGGHRAGTEVTATFCWAHQQWAGHLTLPRDHGVPAAAAAHVATARTPGFWLQAGRGGSRQECLGPAGPGGLSAPLACTWTCRQCEQGGRVSPAGGDGFRQPVQVMEVVVRGQELVAGGTDGGGLQGPAYHP